MEEKLITSHEKIKSRLQWGATYPQQERNHILCCTVNLKNELACTGKTNVMWVCGLWKRLTFYGRGAKDKLFVKGLDEIMYLLNVIKFLLTKT